ncbi:MAG: hypothetical protein R6X32_02730 [Chloroflexota bacterium]
MPQSALTEEWVTATIHQPPATDHRPEDGLTPGEEWVSWRAGWGNGRFYRQFRCRCHNQVVGRTAVLVTRVAAHHVVGQPVETAALGAGLLGE